MTIVITGATGQLGRMIIGDLLAAGTPPGQITAVARDRGRAADLAARGIGVRIADYDRPETFTGWLEPADRVLLISGGAIGRLAAQHAAVIDAASVTGVAQLAYVGMFGGPKADFRLGAEHAETEQRILDSGLSYTFLRNNWYSDGPALIPALPDIRSRGAIVNSVEPGSRIATAPRRDYAAAAAVVMRTDGHGGKAYELSGDTAWTFEEFAGEVSRQSGTEVVHTYVTPERQIADLVAVGMPRSFAEILVDTDVAISKGRLAGTPGDLSRLIGRPTTPVATSIAEALR